MAVPDLKIQALLRTSAIPMNCTSLTEEVTSMGGLWKLFPVTSQCLNYAHANFQTCSAGIVLAGDGKTGFGFFL